jgi:DNA-directed RNA polymerase II subunit RPB1
MARCKTCDCSYAGSGSKMDDCPGHFGHVELCRPVYHCGFIDEVVRLLRCVCFSCSRLLLDENSPKDREVLKVIDPETRFRRVHDRCKRESVRCETTTTDSLNTFLDGVNGVEGNGNGTSRASADLVKSEAMEFMDVLGGGNGNSHEDGTTQPSASATSKPPCGATMPKFRREGMTVYITYPEDMEVIPGTGQRRQVLSAQKAFEVLRRISDEDVVKIGFDPKWARPEWMLVTVLPVPPPHVRPTVMEGDIQSEDDLTFQLTNIVKANMVLEDAIIKGHPRLVIADLEALLQARITSFFDNERDDTPRETQKTGRPLKTLRQRLRGKEGRIRGNLMGKRVDFSARTVITADPNLSIDQVGVPRSVALILTVPVTVTPFNINELRQLVANGPLVWPGAMYIIRADQSRIDLRYVRSKNDIVLEYGWTVERHLRDDDIVLFNRQPSLHKMSIMGHRAKVLDWSTFRLNLSVTTPYNADFDGDEMNLHVPQSITARADADNLMMVPRNIITPQNNRNVMGIVQDALLGVRFMTLRDVFIEKDVFMCAMMWIPTWDGTVPAPAIVKPRPLWTGKQLFSMIAPKINYRGKSKNHKDDPKIKDPFNYLDSEVLIHNGVLLQGIVDKNIVGTSGGSIVHVTWLQRGWEETRNFMNQIQGVVNFWMANTSYTVSVSDTVADADTIHNIQSALNEAKEKVRNIMAKAQSGRLTMMPGKLLMESFEMNINEVLNDARSTVGKSAQFSLKERNAIKGTVMAGSKGSELNISQIIACVGQQNVQGKRIRYGFNQRTLPHFAKDDLGMESRGFVENSYLRGLSPQEFFFHAMGGREGCIDTAVKTAETGYIQRRMVKAMETVMARYDTTLRNARGCVMQFLYGEDGMDAQRIEKQVFDSYDLSQSKFREVYHLDLSSDLLGRTNFIVTKTNQPGYFMHPLVIEACRNDPELRMMLDEEYDQLLRDRVQLRGIMACRGAGSESDASTYLPVNVDRLMWNAQRQFRINTQESCPLHPRVVLEAVRTLCQELIIVVGDDPISREAQHNATLLFQIFLRSKLATKRVLREYRLSKEALEWVIGSIRSDFRSSVVHPGEMCGVLAAQSIGEPATQMTLNTFHNTGIGAKNVTLGVPRLNEILNVGKNIKTPSNIINLKIRNDQREATSVITKIEFIKLGDITLRTEIHYDPDPRSTIVEDDKELVAFAAEFLNVDLVDFNPEDLSPWVLRIILDEKFIGPRIEQDPNFSLADIADKITEHFGNGVHVIYSDNNSTNGYVLRVRILMNDEGRGANAEGGDQEDAQAGNEDHELLRRMQRNLLEDLHLFGVPGIKKVYLSRNKKAVRWNDAAGFEQCEEWVLETDGSNLAEVMTFPQVDHTTTTSNDLVEMFQVLGIEGARACLFNELRNVLSFDGAYVNYRHIACLADCMTFGGYLMAVSRHGINKGETGPMLRASFEETVEVFMNSAAFSHSDTFNGVTENVMLGQLGKLGTGLVDLLLDQEKLSGAIDTMVNEGVDEEIGAADALFKENGDATPFTTNTPYTNASPGWVGGSATPMFGAFTPATATPYVEGSPSAGYLSPYYNPASATSPNIYQSMSPSYVSMSPSRSMAGAGLASPAYGLRRYSAPGA